MKKDKNQSADNLNFSIINSYNNYVYECYFCKLYKGVVVSSKENKNRLKFDLKYARKILRDLYRTKYAQSCGFSYRINFNED